MPLVALECIGIPAAKAPSFKHSRPESFEQQVLNPGSLIVSLETDHSEVGVFIRLIGITRRDGLYHCLGFRLVDVAVPQAVGERYVALRGSNRSMPHWRNGMRGLAV